jgi:transposase
MNIKNQPSKVSATQWGKTVTIEVEHSDTDLLELIEMFKALAVGLEYSESSWRSVIKDLGAMYEEEDTEDLKHKLNEWKNEDSIDSFVRGLDESQIDAALAEHNAHEEGFELTPNCI